ncbi:MAG: hypothetical protein RML40_06720 [Bacteroidota bacterium]|nr:hypothetical protein [Candidatus Kapabacteria bacterium]MDW8220209.1 hypothetical protein [Bacteroidota bacterium]
MLCWRMYRYVVWLTCTSVVFVVWRQELGYAQFSMKSAVVLENQKFSFREILTMVTVSQNDIVLRRCTIMTDSLLADPMLEREWRQNLLSASGKDGRIFVDAKLQFDSCRLAPMKISGFHFAQGLAFNGCVIDEYLGFQKCVIASLGVSKTTIATNVEVEGLVNFELDRCSIGSCVFASNNVNSVNYEQCRFTQFSQVFAPVTQPLNQFSVQRCVIDSSGTLHIDGYVRSCTLSEDTTYGVLNFSPVVLNALSITRCTFHGAVMYGAFNTPERATTMRWEQFAGYKLTVNDTVTGKRVQNRDEYEMLLKTYSFFHNVYSKNWQDESKNNCYVEMKTMQTRWLGIVYQNEPTFTNWLVWQLNLFLEVFCDYGTEPVMAIQYSLYIVLLFAAIYCILPSQLDVSHGVHFTHTLYNLLTHSKERTRTAMRLAKELDALHHAHQTAPSWVQIVGLPFYYGHSLLCRLRLWSIYHADSMHSIRQQLPQTTGQKKVMLLVAQGCYISTILLLAVLIRCTNAVALSVNAFVTLGYGEIQARGIARYLAVLEGALGWFLLSIFSVSLISQVLQ